VRWRFSLAAGFVFNDGAGLDGQQSAGIDNEPGR